MMRFPFLFVVGVFACDIPSWVLADSRRYDGTNEEV